MIHISRSEFSHLITSSVDKREREKHHRIFFASDTLYSRASVCGVESSWSSVAAVQTHCLILGSTLHSLGWRCCTNNSKKSWDIFLPDVFIFQFPALSPHSPTVDELQAKKQNGTAGWRQRQGWLFRLDTSSSIRWVCSARRRFRSRSSMCLYCAFSLSSLSRAASAASARERLTLSMTSLVGKLVNMKTTSACEAFALHINYTLTPEET